MFKCKDNSFFFLFAHITFMEMSIHITTQVFEYPHSKIKHCGDKSIYKCTRMYTSIHACLMFGKEEKTPR